MGDVEGSFETNGHTFQPKNGSSPVKFPQLRGAATEEERSLRA